MSAAESAAITRYVVPFESITLRHAAIVGGKNASLGEMIGSLARLGVRVPDGFATTAEAYRELLRQDRLDARIAKRLAGLDVEDIAALAAAGREIRGWILRARFPARLEADVLAALERLDRGRSDRRGPLAVAVRSSATAEDLPEASFAGQQETFLNVRGGADVLRAMREVFASLYNDRAIAYRAHHGFDHAAVHEGTGRVYVAHTANDALDVLDIEAGKYVGSVPGLTGVAGALVATDPDLVFTSNRGEDTVAVFSPEEPGSLAKIPVGVRPNGLAYDPGRARLLAAHVGDPGVPGSCTVSLVDVRARTRVADLPVAGRTRWTVHDPGADVFHVNIADPPQVVEPGAGLSGPVREAQRRHVVGIHRLTELRCQAKKRLRLACIQRRLGNGVDRTAVRPFPADFELHSVRRLAFFEARVHGAFEAELMQDSRQMRCQAVSPAAVDIRPAAEQRFIRCQASLELRQQRLSELLAALEGRE